MSDKTPSFMDMMKTFGKEVIEYAKQGAPSVTENQYNTRIKTCASCPHLKRASMRCGKCGCLVEHKAKWATTTCPDKRWPKVKVGETGTPLKLGKKKKDDGKGDTPKAGEQV